VVNPRWTGFTHTAKAQMQCQDDLPIPSETRTDNCFPSIFCPGQPHRRSFQESAIYL